MFDSAALQLGCMLTFVVAVLAVSVYFVYGPIRTTYMDATQPDILARCIVLHLQDEERIGLEKFP